MPVSESKADLAYVLLLCKRKADAFTQAITALEEIETVDRAFERLHRDTRSRVLLFVAGGGLGLGRGGSS